MKHPNGYGAVEKLGGNRRKPFGVRVTVGWDDNGKQIRKYISYHEKRSDALIALAEFNKNPFDATKASTTFAQIFEALIKEKFPDGPTKKERSSWNGYHASYNHASILHKMKFIDVRKKELQKVIDDCTKGHGTKRKIKVLFNQMFRYAMEHDLITKDYSNFVDLGKNDEGTSRLPFTIDEIKTLWANVERDNVIKLILILIYTGMRPGELVEVKTESVNLDERYFRGGFKTEAGTNRVIPIHKDIHGFIAELAANGHEFLVTNNDNKQMTYHNFYNDHFKRIMKQLEMTHKPHDCRHTFATLMDNADANKLAIKRIMGHASKDITDKVYTHKDIEQLLKAIDLLII
ncbi:integrase [[Bacillus] sp. KCTC 13219]|nr:integrase [[Bacillus] sp. KCTC 13219]